jgi:CheY-like chemotaxis protein
LVFDAHLAQVQDPETSALLGVPQGDYVGLTVRDTGCGMNRRTVDQIFDPFFTTKGPGEGTGLGLSVVHGIISNHGGAIQVYSEVGKGTAFHLYFPTAEGTVEAAPNAAKEISRRRNERILYLDDDEHLVFLAKRMLERLGYRISGYTDATIALDEFRSRPREFDFVVTDLSMPRMSGFDFAEQVLAIRQDIRVVISSGYVRPEDQERARSMGIHKLIQKPHTMDMLQQTFDEAFARTPSSAELPSQ